jgi:DHA1 family multidrug resistance protein-like MFS transporter
MFIVFRLGISMYNRDVHGGFMNKKSLLIITFLFFQSVIHNLGHPVTPAFVSGLGIEDYMFGLFFAAMSFGLMVGAPIWGILSDRGHRKLWIILGLSMYTIGQFGFGYVGDQTWMVVFRLFSGFGVVSAITIYTAIIVEQTASKDRGKLLAYLAASSTLGASLGYYLGGFFATNPEMVSLLGTDELKTMFLIQAILNAFYTLMIFLTLKETKVQYSYQQRPSMIEGLKSITKIDRSLLVFFVSVTLINMAATNLSKYIDVYFIDLGYSEQDLGTYVMVTGIVSLLTSIFIVKYATRIKKQLVLMSVMMIISSVIVFIVFRSVHFMVLMYTLYLGYVIMKTIYVPLEQSYIAKEAKEGQYGSMMGLRQSFVSLGMVLGPMIGGFIYDKSPLLLFDFNGYLFIAGVLLIGVVVWIERIKMDRIQKANAYLGNELSESQIKS